MENEIKLPVIPDVIVEAGTHTFIENKKFAQSTTVQTLIFDKNKFNTAEAIKWAHDHDYRSDKVDTTEDSYRIRQKDPGDFKEGSFRTIDITEGVKAVIGKLKSQEMGAHEDKKEEKMKDERQLSIFQSMKDVEVFRSGTWNGDEYNLNDLHDMVNNFNLLKSKLRPRLKLGHDDEQEILKSNGLPAAGYVTNLYVKDNILYADFDNIPDKIFELIKSKQYNDVSVEIYWNMKDENTGEQYNKVLSAIALLGEEQPAVWDNNPLEMFLPGELRAASQKMDRHVYNYNKLTNLNNKLKEIEMAEVKAMENEMKLLVEELKKFKDESESLKKVLLEKEEEARLKEIDLKLESWARDGKVTPAQKVYLKEIMKEIPVKKKYSIESNELDGQGLLEKFLSLGTPVVSMGESSQKVSLDSHNDNFLKATAYAKEHNVSFEQALKIVGKNK